MAKMIGGEESAAGASNQETSARTVNDVNMNGFLPYLSADPPM